MMDKMRTFWLLLFTQSFSMLGSAMSAFAVSVWVYQETGDATPLALAATFAVLPSIFTTGWAGVAVDRYERKTLIMLADAGQALATLLLLGSIASGQFQLWHLYTVAAIESMFLSLQFTAFNSTITMLVPDEKRERANTLLQLTGPLSGIVAPIVAAILLVVVDVEGVLLIDLITFVAAVSFVSQLTIPTPPREDTPEDDGNIWQQMWSGIKILRQVQPIWWLAVGATVINFPMRVVMILQTPYILERTGSEVALGTISGLLSLGMVIGGVIFSIVGGLKTRIQTALAAMSFLGVMFALHGMVQSTALLALTGFLGMFVIASVDASLFSILQAKIRPNQQGRAFAATFQMAQLLRPLAFITAGVLADQVAEPAVGSGAWDVFGSIFGNDSGAGMGLIITVASLTVTSIALLLYAIPQLRNMERDLPDYVADPIETPTDAAPELSGSPLPEPAV